MHFTSCNAWSLFVASEDFNELFFCVDMSLQRAMTIKNGRFLLFRVKHKLAPPPMKCWSGASNG